MRVDLPARRASDGDPVGPVDLEADRAKAETAAFDDRVAQRGGHRTGPGATAISILSCHSLRGSAMTFRWSSIRSVALTLPASFSERATCRCTMCLSLSVALALA